MTYDHLERVCADFHASFQRWAPHHEADTSDRAWRDMPMSYRKTVKQAFRDLLDRGLINLGDW